MQLNEAWKRQPGPWNGEPDEWDGEMMCARRSHWGAWCGYVAVGPQHPLFGKSCNDTLTGVSRAITHRDFNIDKVGAENLFRSSLVPEHIEAGTIEVVMCFDVHGGLIYTGDHVPMSKPDGNWWFGFDCEHAGDTVPCAAAPDDGNERTLRYLHGLFDEEYRTLEYVKQECLFLAQQLARW